MMRVRLLNNEYMLLVHRNSIFNLLFWHRKYLTVENVIYISKNIKLSSISNGDLLHEYCYYMQQKQMGCLKWFFHYLFNASFRYEQDVIACSYQIHYTFGKSKKIKVLNTEVERLLKTRYGKHKTKQEIASHIKHKCSYQDFLDYLN